MSAVSTIRRSYVGGSDARTILGKDATGRSFASDVEDGSVPSSGLSWQINIHHCPFGVCHVHFFLTLSGATNAFSVPVSA